MITAGLKTTIARVTATNNAKRIFSRLAVISHADFSPLVFKRSVNTGIKAALTAPSPKIFLCMLGMRKATKKASAAADEPNCMAITKSRSIPKILETRVMPPTAPAARLTFLLFSIHQEGRFGRYSDCIFQMVLAPQREVGVYQNWRGG